MTIYGSRLSGGSDGEDDDARNRTPPEELGWLSGPGATPGSPGPSGMSGPPTPTAPSRPLLNRTTIIIAALVAVLVGGTAAGAATFLGGGDEPAPRSTGSPPAAGPGSAAATSSSPAAAAPISMSATGDIVMGKAPQIVPPNNGKGIFDGVKDALRADFQMGNLEQTLTEDTGYGKCSAGSKNCHAFRTAPGTAETLKDAGFHLVNLANNHAYDFEAAGYRNTQAALNAVGIKYTGWPGQVTVVDVKGVKVAVVGFASYPRWSNACFDLDASKRVITAAAGQADIVVVQVHMGAEGAAMTRVRPGTETFLGENRCDPIKFSHTVIDAGADLVVGHGPHVVRGMEFYQGRLIAYSLGNFVGYGGALGRNGVVGLTAVIRVELNRDGSWAGGKLISTHMVSPGVPQVDPRKQSLNLITSVTKQDFPQTGAKIAPDGVITP